MADLEVIKKRRPFAPDEIKLALTLHDQGWGKWRIARHMNRSPRSVEEMLGRELDKRWQEQMRHKDVKPLPQAFWKPPMSRLMAGR